MRKTLLLILFSAFLGAASCELNEKDCEISTKYGNAVISLLPRPIKPMVESKLIIKGLNELKAPKIHLYGLSMYLGHLRENLELNDKNELEADIMIAPCDDEEMRFALEILQNDEIIANIEFSTFR